MKAAFQAQLNEEFEARQGLQAQQGRLAWTGAASHLDREGEE